jgi:hypothetical protein
MFLRPVASMLPTTQSFEGMPQLLAGGGFSHRTSNGARAECDVFCLRDFLFPLDFRIRAVARIVGEAGMT